MMKNKIVFLSEDMLGYGPLCRSKLNIKWLGELLDLLFVV